MPKVFIPQTPSRRVKGEWVMKYDLSAAEEFGELVHLTRPGMLTQTSVERITQTFRNKLRDFGPDDSILAVGDPVAIGIAVTYASQSHRIDGPVKMLRYDRAAGRYAQLTIPFQKGIDPKA